jgi:hypothetical protein
LLGSVEVAQPIALDREQQAAKEAAIRCYRTQFETLNGGPVGRLCQPAVLGFELRWDVPSGWTPPRTPAASPEDR